MARSRQDDGIGPIRNLLFWPLAKAKGGTTLHPSQSLVKIDEGQQK